MYLGKVAANKGYTDVLLGLHYQRSKERSVYYGQGRGGNRFRIPLSETDVKGSGSGIWGGKRIMNYSMETTTSAQV